MVSIRRRKLLGLCSGRNSSVAPLSKSEHVQYPENRVDNTKPVSVHPMVLDDIDPPKEKISVEIGPGSSNVPASSPSKEHPIHQFPDVVELFELELIRDVYLRPTSSREYERLILRKQPFEDFCLMSKKEEFLHRRHPTLDMAIIVAATSTAGRKGLKGTSAGAKKVRERVERVSREAAVHEARAKMLPTQRDDELAPEVLSMLPADVQTAASNFYKYWTERWQNFMESGEPKDVIATLVSQTARSFGTAIEVHVLFNNLQGKKEDAASRVAVAEEEASKAKVEVAEFKRLKDEESVKLASALNEIENLKKEVHICQSEVASMTRRVETSDAHQRISAEALESLNKEHSALRVDFENQRLENAALNSKVASLTEEVEEAWKEAESVGTEAEKRFVTNFHLTEVYKNFAIYWRRYAYSEMVEWIEANNLAISTSDLRELFLEEEPEQGIDVPAVGDEVVEVDDEASEVDDAEVDPLNALVPFTPPPPPPPTSI